MKKSSLLGFPFWSSLIMLMASLGGLILSPAFMLILRNASYDALQRSFPREYRPAPVRILDVDEQSLEMYGQWPWPRTHLAKIVQALSDRGAAVIVFDMVFAEPDRTSPAALTRLWPMDTEIAHLVKRLPEHDQVFAAAVEKGRVVTGISLTTKNKSKQMPVLKSRFIMAGDNPHLFLPAFPGAVANLQILETAAAGNGVFNFKADYDGVVRHVPLLVRVNDTMYPSLSAESLRVFQGVTNIMITSAGTQTGHWGENGVTRVRIGNIDLNTDAQADVWLHFSPHLPERYIPVWQLLAGEVDTRLLKDHIVFVGTSSAGLSDLRLTPLGDIMPGVEIHAQLVEQAIQGTLLTNPVELTNAMAALLFILVWGLLVFALSRTAVLWSILLGAGVMAGVCLTAVLAVTQFRIFFDPLYPVLSLLGIFMTYLVSRHFKMEREQRWIRNAFSSYVSPNLVRYMLANPNQLALGGEKRECSFVLTDLAGFTTLMEQFDPTQISTLLNNYLDGMVEIAFRHHGTLDRFVGDAIAVIFSAPITQPDHAARAVACAMEMDRFARNFSDARQKEGIPFGRTRIGVHTGVVLVGNFGGKQMIDYRALGDPINTAARLERANKYLGTQVCISAVTVDQCPDFFGRPVGVLALEGKSEQMAAFEPLTKEESESSRITAYRKAYQLLEEQNDHARDAFTTLANNYEADPLAIFHLKRLEKGKTGTTVVLEGK